MSKNKLQELKNGGGFFTFNLENNELEKIKKIVNQQFLKIINFKYPNLNLDQSINKYHEISHKVDHANIWSMKSRVLPKEKYQELLNLSFIKKLSEIFGKFNISDENNLGYGEIIWRLVRPKQLSDVGAIHCDKWFWDLNPNHYMPKNFQRVKCWISLWCDGKNGLQFYPGSQLNDFQYKSEQKHGYVKPIFDHSKIINNLKKQNCIPGTVIIFNDKLLHGGVINEGSETRVSVEFTMFIDRKKFD